MDKNINNNKNKNNNIQNNQNSKKVVENKQGEEVDDDIEDLNDPENQL